MMMMMMMMTADGVQVAPERSYMLTMAHMHCRRNSGVMADLRRASGKLDNVVSFHFWLLAVAVQ